MPRRPKRMVTFVRQLCPIIKADEMDFGSLGRRRGSAAFALLRPGETGNGDGTKYY